MQTRERIHRLIDETPDSELAAIERFLNERRRPAWATAFAEASIDDEPVTPEDEAALAEAYSDVAAGRLVADADARRRLLGRS